MADLKLDLAFGLKKVGSSGTDIVSTNAHWFMDSFWTTAGSYDSEANCHYRPVIRITNPYDYPVHIKSVTFSLINGSSGGESFTDSSGSSHTTYASTATMTAYVNNVASGSLQVGQGNSVFVKSTSPGQSYWKYRPSNSSGELNPDGDGGSKVDRYKFEWSNPQMLAAKASILVYFTATFNTSGSHLIQIYATGAMSSPVTHRVTFNFDGGTWNNASSYSEYVDHGKGVSQVPSPTKANYKFKHWNPNNTAYNNVTTDLTYTAVWEPDTAEVIFYRNKDSNDNVTLGKGSGTIGIAIGSGTDTINPSIRASNGESLDDVVSANKSTALTLTELKGYNFHHWAKNNDYNKISASQSPTYMNLSKVNINADSSKNVFYAMWIAKSGTVTFYRNYDPSDMTVVDNGSRSNVSYIRETLGSTKPDDPTRLGHKFLGWALTRTGSVKSDNLSLWDTAEDKPITAFYAVWEKVCTVWVRVNGIWVKKLNVRKYRASSGTWEEIPPRIRSNGNWE